MKMFRELHDGLAHVRENARSRGDQAVANRAGALQDQLTEVVGEVGHAWRVSQELEQRSRALSCAANRGARGRIVFADLEGLSDLALADQDLGMAVVTRERLLQEIHAFLDHHYRA